MQNESPTAERPAGPIYGDIWHPRERAYAIVLHLSALVAFFTYGFGGTLGPLVIWLIFRKRSDMVDFHGKKALNYQLSMLVYWVCAFLVAGAFFIVGGGLAIGVGESGFDVDVESTNQQGIDVWIVLIAVFLLIGSAILLAVAAVWLIWTIRAAVRASRGDPPGYILAIQFLR